MKKQDFAAGTADKGSVGVSGRDLQSWIKEARERKNRTYPRGSSAVLIPFLIRDGAYHVLYEIRAAKLRSQPGEICFPGGRIEAGEKPIETAIREATEELCIDRSQIEIVGALDNTIGPGTVPLFTFIGVLHDYKGTWSREEVDRVFTQPLDWILANDPDIYRINLERKMPEDFPYDYVPGGREYRWREQFYSVPFYPQVQTELSLFKVPEDQTIPVLWGVTARVTHSLAVLLREGVNGQ
jgi:8-oxo-dGTP pyrophosphatase MutT (NUDIX family)